MEMNEFAKRYYTCGTRAVVRPNPTGAFYVICATCGAGGSVRHTTLTDATKAATRDSSKACKICGAS
jgi:hypothetical protein